MTTTSTPPPSLWEAGYDQGVTTAQFPVEEITARAREVRFSRVLLTLVLGFFYMFGWAAGRAWIGVVMCALAVRRGWREGQGIPEPSTAAPVPNR